MRLASIPAIASQEQHCLLTDCYVSIIYLRIERIERIERIHLWTQ